MIDQGIVDALRNRFVDVHPLAFHRSVERAETPGELFDILDTMPNYPYVWDEVGRRWKQETDITQSKRVELIEKKQGEK